MLTKETAEKYWNPSYRFVASIIPENADGAEIGVGFGGMAEHILWRNKAKSWTSIDPVCDQPKEEYTDEMDCEQAEWDRRYAAVLKRMERFTGFQLMRMRSVEAAAECVRLGRTFDLVYIDGNHARKAVMDDIVAWMPLIRPGGFCCGHDYYHPYLPGVKQAVDEYFGVGGVEVDTASTVWYRRVG